MDGYIYRTSELWELVDRPRGWNSGLTDPGPMCGGGRWGAGYERRDSRSAGCGLASCYRYTYIERLLGANKLICCCVCTVGWDKHTFLCTYVTICMYISIDSIIQNNQFFIRIFRCKVKFSWTIGPVILKSWSWNPEKKIFYIYLRWSWNPRKSFRNIEFIIYNINCWFMEQNTMIPEIFNTEPVILKPRGE